LSPNGAVWQVIELGSVASNRLKQLGISPPPPVLQVKS
jgi:hypothetical protein